MSKDEDTPEMRILKKATCKSISGKSTLTYQIGCTPSNDIHFRIYANTAGGFYSNEFVSLKDILDVFGEVPKGQPITSFVLQPLFRGKSVNTPAFLVAALANEKLLQLLKGKKRGHIVVDPEDFLSRVEKLMASGVKPKGTTRKTTRKTTATSTKKAAIKKRSTARKKATTRKKTS